MKHIKLVIIVAKVYIIGLSQWKLNSTKILQFLFGSNFVYHFSGTEARFTLVKHRLKNANNMCEYSFGSN